MNNVYSDCMQVKDIMSREIISVEPSETISDAISLMERHHIHEVPVISARRLVGIIDQKCIANKSLTNPNAAKVYSCMGTPPAVISPEDEMSKAAKLIFDTGLRGLPVCIGSSITGFVSVFDIVSALAPSKDFRQTRSEAVMSPPESIGADVDIGNARAIMREKNISRLPVIASDGKLAGVVTIFDLLKSVKPHERQGFYSMSAETEKTMDIPVSTIMNTEPITAGKNATLNEIASLMVNRKTSGIVITENERPIGIITVMDLLELYVSGMQPHGLYVQITGLPKEDESLLDTVERQIRDTVSKLSTMYTPQYFFMHIKTHGDRGISVKRVKYTVHARLKTEKGAFISRACEWDLRDAIGNALDQMEKITIKEKETMRDKVKKHLAQVKNILRAR